MYREWSADFEQIQKLIKDADSVIREFGPERSLTLTRTIVQSIKCDCSCAPSNTDPVTGSESVSNTDLFNPPASLSVTKDIREALIQVGRRLSANMFGPPIHLETNGEVQWALHAITYGLTLPFEHWDVIKHSLHIYCFWLRSLAPCRSGSVSLSSACPQVFRREPHRHFTSILFALTYAFLPRSPDPLSDRIKWLISSIGQTVCKRSSIDEAVESTSDVQNVSDRPTLQTQLSRQLELTRMVTHCIESLLSQSNEWAPAVWDSVLQFCLVICHYVLAFPLPIPGQRILPSTGIPNVNAGGSTGVVTGAALATAVGTAGPMGSSSVAVTITAGGGNTAGATVSDSGYSGEEVNKTVADLAENIAESVFGLLMNTWLKACTYCFPRPQMWVALKECVKVWRHQTAVLSIWSSCVIALTSQLLLSLHKTVSNKSTDLNSSILGKISPTVLPPEMSLSAVKEAWFRFLHIMGNPVDLCDPHVLATPVLEECRKTTATQRVGRASVYLPYIYHQMIRAVANVVDGFLGIQPSLTIGVHAALGVPLELYGLTSVSSPVGGQKLSVVESDGPESKKFSLTGNAAPQIQRSSLPYEKSSSRKLRLGGMVTSASHLASAGAGMRHSTFGTSALQMDAALTPLGTTPPTLSSLASSLNQSAIGLSPLSSTHLVTTKPGISGALVQVPSGQSQTPGARPSVVASGSTPLTFGSIISPQLVLLNTMANHWLGPETVSVITTRCDQFSSGLSFQVGRAEALSTLCRIVIYARRHNLAREYLIRFYLCLYYGLETETGRNRRKERKKP
ncbi:hypothetical protein D915_009032 [Fasciola hepatica]|uniref:Ral GTPase-activating protein subunit alpha/beta N-terminal domain-containing protein n=1 Tax=Fasciola hepatica TaxID=6192 RepID=A0A4E0QY74_FASHE|nr:hypothetical protein D915_009032 [Fasciola hepatica]